MLVSIVQPAQPVEVDVQVPIRDTFLTRDLAPSSAVLDPLSLILAYPDFSRAPLAHLELTSYHL